jgi:hypothetical protein
VSTNMGAPQSAAGGDDDIDEPRQTLSGESASSKSHVRYNPEGAFSAACAARPQPQIEANGHATAPHT